MKHITYKWQDGPTKSVSLADEVQLPQVQVKGFRVKEKLEILSTGRQLLPALFSVVQCVYGKPGRASATVLALVGEIVN